MKAHELQPGNFYRAEKTSTVDGRLLTDVAVAISDGHEGSAVYQLIYCHGGAASVGWDYFGPIALQTTEEILAAMRGEAKE